MKFSDVKITLASKRWRPSATDLGQGKKPVGVILDWKDREYVPLFLELKEEPGFAGTSFYFLYCGKRKTDEASDAPVFLKDHLRWNGKISDKPVLDFLNRPYELLISFCREENTSGCFLTSVISAQLKIGNVRPDHPEDHLNLAIRSAEKEPGIFIREIRKYLKCITTKTA